MNVLQNGSDQLFGSLGFHRHVGATGLECRDIGDDEIHRRRHQDRHQTIDAGAQIHQLAPEQVALTIELGESESPVHADDRRLIGRLGRLGAEMFVQTTLGRIVNCLTD